MDETPVEAAPGTPLTVIQAANLLAGIIPAGADDAALERLLADNRMSAVWAELSKKQRTQEKAPFYKATMPQQVGDWSSLGDALRSNASARLSVGDYAGSLLQQFRAGFAARRAATEQVGPLAMEQEQALAMAVILVMAFRTYYMGDPTVRRSEVDQALEALDEQGRLQEAVALQRTLAEPPHAGRVVKRRRTDPKLEGFILDMADTIRTLFGSPLYSVIATISNVTFGRTDITKEKVRDLLRPYNN